MKQTLDDREMAAEILARMLPFLIALRELLDVTSETPGAEILATADTAEGDYRFSVSLHVDRLYETGPGRAERKYGA